MWWIFCENENIVGVSFRGGNGFIETKEVRGGEFVCKFGVIVVWLEEGLGLVNF